MLTIHFLLKTLFYFLWHFGVDLVSPQKKKEKEKEKRRSMFG